MAHEIVMLSPDEVLPNPFAPPCSPEIMEELLDTIESAEKWANTWGSARGCDKIIIDMVVMILEIGTHHWGFKPTLEKVRIRWPSATPTTWWLLMQSDNNLDAMLFDKLATCAEHFHPYVMVKKHCKKFALGSLALVRDEMRDYNVGLFSRQAEEYDAFAAGAGPIIG
jgi:hypothetical protein